MKQQNKLILPKTQFTITKGETFKGVLGPETINCLANNILVSYPKFDATKFKKNAIKGVEPLELLERGRYLGDLLFEFLPKPYSNALSIILNSLTPALIKTEKNGLGVFFYLPHTSFVAKYGINSKYNNGKDPFKISMNAQYELTRRFTAEYSIRPFLIAEQERTLKTLKSWLTDPCPHIRRLCSEGTRPRLPWGVRIPSFVQDPSPSLEILEALKDDPILYVRRSVANHIGDIAKDHPELSLKICRSWLKGATSERKWVIRHAVRYLAKKGDQEAIKIRKDAV